MIIWLTGLSGAGKSTIAQGLAESMRAEGVLPLMIDGDGLREELSKDLGFSDSDRMENIRRAGAVALMAARSGITSICSLISPLRRERDEVRTLCAERGILFYEVHISTPLEICEQRDPKGLYKKARGGLILKFTGIDSPYEAPLSPQLVIPTERLSVEESIGLLRERISEHMKSNLANHLS
jgi:adenylyl-sulfate kinase